MTPGPIVAEMEMPFRYVPLLLVGFIRIIVSRNDAIFSKQTQSDIAGHMKKDART